MNRMSTALAFAIGLTSSAFLAAQSGTSTGAQSGTSTAAAPGGQAQRAQPGTITVTGCLERSEANGATTAPATSTTGGYVLANATMSGAGSSAGTSGTSTATAGAAATGSTGTSGAAAGGRGMGRSYTLLDQNSGELAPHVGHQIEVTGTLATATTGSTGDTSNAAPAGRGMMANQRLQVSSMRMLAATCPAAASTTTR